MNTNNIWNNDPQNNYEKIHYMSNLGKKKNIEEYDNINKILMKNLHFF